MSQMKGTDCTQSDDSSRMLDEAQPRSRTAAQCEADAAILWAAPFFFQNWNPCQPGPRACRVHIHLPSKHQLEGYLLHWRLMIFVRLPRALHDTRMA